MSKQAHRPIWSKRQGDAADAAADGRALAYCAGRDVAARPPADSELIPYDLWTNRAHCLMLKRRGIIDSKTHRAISRGLDRLEKQWWAGDFALDPGLEDVHINTERFVADTSGEAAAGAMHTARSRNDQSATDMRLWLRDRVLERLEALAGLIESVGKFAGKHSGTLAPGWTHGQPAMPTTLGHWAAAHGFAFARDAEALQMLWQLINLSPLGAAASFGTTWPVDRKMTARLLGFDRPLANSLDAISTRWECEARVGAALGVMMTHLSSLGQDLIFLSSPPRAALRLPDSHVTGSSIMPNKRNPDFAEVTRARAASVQALAQTLMSVGRGALSGYNRDTQWTKYWVMDLIYEVGEAPEVFAEAIAGVEVDKKVLAALATDGFALAADLADHVARTRGLPFRKAYHVIAEAVAADEAHTWFRLETLNAILKRERITPPMSAEELRQAGDARKVLQKRQSEGGPAPKDVREQVSALSTAAAAIRRFTAQKKRSLDKARELCRAAGRD